MRALISSSLVAALSGNALAVGTIALLFAYPLTIALVVTLALAVTVAFGAAFLRREAAWLETTIEDRNRLNGLLLGLLSGISQLRVAGAELRAHALWQRGYAFQQEAQRNASLQALRATVLQGLLPGLFLLAVIVAIEVFEGGDTSLGGLLGHRRRRRPARGRGRLDAHRRLRSHPDSPALPERSTNHGGDSGGLGGRRAPR